MTKPRIFRGAGVAIVTPYNETGINYPALGKLIDWQIENHTDAIIIAGTTGEASTMSDEEHKEAIRFTVERVNHRVPVIAGTGSNDTEYAVQLSQYAEKVGADGLLLVTPYYNKCTQKGLVAHFSAIADSVKIPCIVYHIPSRTGVTIQLATFKKLAAKENIVAVKEASGNLSEILRLRRECPELAIYSGNDDQIVPILSIGGEGVISVLSNIAPKETHDMCQAYFDGDTKKAEELQIAYSNLIDALFCEVNPIPVKTALNLMGYNAGNLRLPLTDMEDATLARLKKAMQEKKLL